MPRMIALTFCPGHVTCRIYCSYQARPRFNPCQHNHRYTGTRGAYTQTFELEANKQCVVCSPGIALRMPADSTLQDVIARLQKDYPERLLSPSVSYGTQQLYMRGVLEEATRGNLGKPMEELLVRA